MWESFNTALTPLEPYWPLFSNPVPGEFVNYDLVTYGRVRPMVNTREGQAFSVEGPNEGFMSVKSKRWSDKILISPTELRDWRAPGQTTGNREAYAIASKTLQLRLRWTRFVEWLRAEGFLGVMTFTPPGLDSEMDELLLCSDDCLVPSVAVSWNSPAATEAEARANLEAIRLDFEVAEMSIAASGGVCDAVLMNSATRGYIESQMIAAGYEYLIQMIYQGGITRFYNQNIITDNESYVHPLTGTVVNYVPDGVAIFFDTNAARAGRQLMECDAVDTGSPNRHTGIWMRSWEEPEMPGGWTIAGEWSGAPIIMNPCGSYIFEDVTNEGGT